MKRTAATLFLLFFLLSSLVPTPGYAQVQAKKIPVLIDEVPVNFDVDPIIKNGRTLIPFRALAEALNVTVTWDAKTRTVNASDGKIPLSLQIGNSTAYRSSIPVTLDEPPIIVNGRTLIPLRFFSEAFGCQVNWDEAAHTVRIISPPKAMSVTGYYALGDSATSSWTDLFGQTYPGIGQTNADIVSDVAFGWYSLGADGSLLTKSTTGWRRPDGWETVLETASKHNLNTEMVVHLTDSNGAINSIISSEAATNKAVTGIVEEARQYQGVNLDLEGLGWKDTGAKLTTVRNNFTRFVSSLSAQLKANDIKLTLSLHAPNSAYPGYDYKSLGQLADRIIIMAYDYGAKPEPVNLVIQAVEKTRAEVPAEKLVLGISAPNENPQSILAKVGIAKRYNLNGIALWRLGLVPDEMWNSLRTTIQPR